MRYQIEGKLLARHEYSISRFSPFARAICRLYPAARGQAHVSVPPRWRRPWSPRITATTFPSRVFPRIFFVPLNLYQNTLYSNYPCSTARSPLKFQITNKSYSREISKVSRNEGNEFVQIKKKVHERIYIYIDEEREKHRIQPLPIPKPSPIVC